MFRDIGPGIESEREPLAILQLREENTPVNDGDEEGEGDYCGPVKVV